jgi:hypothetical protein
MKNEKLNSAIEVLLDQLKDQVRGVSETKRTINALRRSNGEGALFPDVEEDIGISQLRADQFYGKPLATSAQEFLERRKQACPADEILKGLDAGSFDFKSLGWPEKDRLRNVSVSLAKNTKTFHRLPNGTFGLLSWYPEVLKREREREGQAPKEKTATETGAAITEAADNGSSANNNAEK